MELEVNIDDQNTWLQVERGWMENCHLTNERDFEKVREFKYLGALITENNKLGKK